MAFTILMAFGLIYWILRDAFYQVNNYVVWWIRAWAPFILLTNHWLVLTHFLLVGRKFLVSLLRTLGWNLKTNGFVFFSYQLVGTHCVFSSVIEMQQVYFSIKIELVKVTSNIGVQLAFLHTNPQTFLVSGHGRFRCWIVWVVWHQLV